ncbi:MAG: fibronectin type III domain-containing protein, partial [Nanoarchaeota archaeon]
MLAIFLIQLVLTLPFYTASAYALTISNVRVAGVSSTSAKIQWDTDIRSNGRVRYGKTAAIGFTERHENFVTNHTLTLINGMDSDTAYFFAVESTDAAGITSIDNNSNNFYTFKTTDIRPPPQVTGLAVDSVTTSSISLSWTSVSITDFSHYLIYRNNAKIANSTANRFDDTGLSTNTEYSYKVSAVDISGNEGPQSDTVIGSTLGVDSSIPIISNVDALPLTDTTARITWLTNENATTTVLYGINKTDKAKSSSDLEVNHTIVIDGLAKNSRILFTVKS